MKTDISTKTFNENDLPKRVDKTIAWLVDSRDSWKEKCIEAKKDLKIKTQDCKRINESRNDWKLKNIRLKVELSELKHLNSTLTSRLDELESLVISKNHELFELKKKQ